MPPQRVVENRLDRPWAQPVGGILLLAIGGFLLKVSLFDTIREVGEHAPQVSYSTRGALFGVFSVVFAVVLLVASAKGVSLRHRKSDLGLRDPVTRKLTARGWAVVVVSAAIGIGVELAFRSYLRAHGYDSR